MKKQLLLMAMAIVLFYQSCYSQFQQTLGDARTQYGKSIQTTFIDGGYIAAGYLTPGNLGLVDANLVKTDQNGNLLWTNVYGGPNNDYFNSVRDITNTGSPLSYVAAGYTSSFGAGSYDMYLVGVDNIGTPLFSRTYGGSQNDRAYCVQKILDPYQKPGYVLVGETNSFPTLFPGTNVYVVRTDLSGNLTDAVVIGTSFNEAGHWIEQTRDGGYIITGYTTARCSSDTIANKNIYVIKLDPFLNVTWNRIFAGPKSREDVGFCVRENPYNNSFIITGHTKSYTNGGESFLLNLSAAGALNWFRVYGGPRLESGENVLITKDAAGVPQYLVSGYSNSFNATFNYDPLIFKTNLGGNILLWSQTYGGTTAEYAYEIDENAVAGPGYTLIGRTASFGAGSTDHLFIEIDNNGFSASACEKKPVQKNRIFTPCINSNAQHVHVTLSKIVQSSYVRIDYKIDKCSTPSRMAAIIPEKEEEISSIKVMPVPAHSSIEVSSKEDCEGATFNILNSQGQLVKTSTLSSTNSTIEISDLVNGIYFIQVIKKDGGIESSKFIKE